MTKTLKNKPLAEVIFELRWDLLGKLESGENIDPRYKVLIGGIYEKVKSEYPFHEPLPTSEIPDRFAKYMIQHRFRKGQNQWPLIQIGPGIIALNDTTDYVWEDFNNRIRRLLDILYEVYPEPEKLYFNMSMLRYINFIEFNFEDDIFRFLIEKMKIGININESLFKMKGVNKSPSDLNMDFSFGTETPKGAIDLIIRSGKREQTDVLIWEIILRSISEDSPKAKEDIFRWSNQAHIMIDDWFFKLIDGEL